MDDQSFDPDDGPGSTILGYRPDSCAAHSSEDDHMDTNSYDSWENDAYYNESGYVDDATKYDTCSPVNLDDSRDPSVEILDPPDLEGGDEVFEEALEENNNDPNNNMGSIEMIGIEEGAQGSIASVPSQSLRRESVVPLVVRTSSPRPGCSKDSHPIISQKPGDPPSDEMIVEKTRHILSLVEKIHRDSIFDALSKNYRKPLSKLKLWDLIPENERREYPEGINFQARKEQNCVRASSARSERNAQQIEKQGKHMQWTITTAASNGAKRGPAEDICTVESKKSSDQDQKIAAPAAPPLRIPNIVATSQANDSVKDSLVYRGAIPKVRDLSAPQHQRTAMPPTSSVAPAAAPLPPSTPIVRAPLSSSTPIVRPPLSSSTPVVRAPFLKYPVAKRSQNVAVIDRTKQPAAPLPPAPAAQQQYRQIEPKAEIAKKEKLLPQAPTATTATIVVRNPVVTARITPNVAESERPKQVLRTPTLLAPTNQQSQSETGRESVKKVQQAPPPAPQAAQQQSTKRIVCMEMYYKLRMIFPNVDPDYMKKLCPPEWGPGNRDDQLAPIIEHLLESGDTLPQAPINQTRHLAAESRVSYTSVDDIYENLLGIFPDADPHYLRDFAVRNIGNPDALKNFVETKLERRDYPTREQYLARLKITEQQRQYTTGFDVKHFLSIIPDPSKHFMDPNRKSIHQTVAFEFLKSYFNKMRVTTISRTYTRCNYNLSLTAEALDALGPDMKSTRSGYEMPTEDILLLQEIAFIKHKGRINQYMANIKATEDEEFRTLKAMNQLLECECCYDSECLPSKCSVCENGHIFCNSCVVTGTSTKMGEGETRILCFVNCGSEFRLSVLQRALAPTTFSILLKKRQAAEVIEAALEGLVSCPFCHFASIPPEGDKIFKCLNPECTKESCRLCKELSHVPLKCDEVMKADSARRIIEEKMTEALARKCYKCQRAFFKEEGCNKITCVCGAQMCYLCDEPIKDYTHFRGQGSDNTKLCPLYSDTIRLDAVAVRKVAEKAQMELLKRNPNIKIDTTGLMPVIPQARNGPHNDVLNADELPRRAQRVLDLPPL